MKLPSLAALSLAISSVYAGPLAYGVCQTGCNGLAVACYTGAGFVFGVPIVTLAALPPAIIGCNVALGTCMVACATTALIAPIP